VQHLAFIRLLPCVACGKAAPSEAAHVRTGTDGGVGRKPGDRYAVPLCTTCHAKQHRLGELTFWSALRIDPINVALRLWTISADVKGGERTVFRARQGDQSGEDIWLTNLKRSVDLGVVIPQAEKMGQRVATTKFCGRLSGCVDREGSGGSFAAADSGDRECAAATRWRDFAALYSASSMAPES
jgi:hypothetical protein